MGCCGDESLPFRVEVWDDKDQHIEELIGWFPIIRLLLALSRKQ